MPSFIREQPPFSDIPTSSSILPERVMHLPEVALTIAEQLSLRDRINFAATDTCLWTLLGQHQALWGGVADTAPNPAPSAPLAPGGALERPAAQVKAVRAWFDRANGSRPELRQALRAAWERPENTPLPDIQHAHASEYEHLQALVRTAALSMAHEFRTQGPGIIADAARLAGRTQAAVSAACTAATAIGLDVSGPLRTLKGRLRALAWSDLALEAATDHDAWSMEARLARAAEAAQSVGLDPPTFPDDAKAGAYVGSITTCQEMALASARRCMPGGIAANFQEIATWAARAGIRRPNPPRRAREWRSDGVPAKFQEIADWAQRAGSRRPGPLPEALQEASREGLAYGMLELDIAASQGDVGRYNDWIDRMSALSRMAGLPEPEVPAYTRLAAAVHGRDAAEADAISFAEQGETDVMISELARANNIAAAAGLPRIDLPAALKRSAFLKALTEAINLARFFAARGDTRTVLSTLNHAADYAKAANEPLSREAFVAVRDTLKQSGGDDKGSILRLFARRAGFHRHTLRSGTTYGGLGKRHRDTPDEGSAPRRVRAKDLGPPSRRTRSSATGASGDHRR
jgi:hypothetical protein